MRNPYEKICKFLGYKILRRTVKNELTDEYVDIQTRTSLQRIVKKTTFRKKKQTYIRVGVEILCDGDTYFLFKDIKI